MLVCGYVHVSTGGSRAQKGVPAPLELELQMASDTGPTLLLTF